MTSVLQSGSVAMRQCPQCGKFAPRYQQECPACHERFSNVRLAAVPLPEKRNQVRRGLLLILLAAVVRYFAGGYGAFTLPAEVYPVVTVYIAPGLFLLGLVLTIHGVYLRTVRL